MGYGIWLQYFSLPCEAKRIAGGYVNFCTGPPEVDSQIQEGAGEETKAGTHRLAHQSALQQPYLHHALMHRIQVSSTAQSKTDSLKPQLTLPRYMQFPLEEHLAIDCWHMKGGISVSKESRSMNEVPPLSLEEYHSLVLPN